MINMKCWKTKFKKTPLKQAEKLKEEIKNPEYDGYSFTSNVDGFDVELVIQDDRLYDMNCSCTRKTPCAHEAAALYFLEEFGEILEDYDKENTEKITKISVNDDLKDISTSKLIKFVKAEFRKNPQFKYDFIKYFEEESMVDTKEYARKLKKILRRGREPGFSHHGFYDFKKISTELKRFVNKDIEVLIRHGEGEFALEKLIEITDIFKDPMYRVNDAWFEIMLSYGDYCGIILSNFKIPSEMKNHAIENLNKLSNWLI